MTLRQFFEWAKANNIPSEAPVMVKVRLGDVEDARDIKVASPVKMTRMNPKTFLFVEKECVLFEHEDGPLI